MIRSDYQSYLGKLKKYFRDFGVDYSGFSEEELGAKFYLYSDWMIELECEKFGSGVTVVIRHPEIGRKDGYAIWILMKAFESLKGKSYGDPSVENQIRFLVEEKQLIFQYPSFYEAEYTRINDVH
ncbi:hypothetical protein [Xylella fastidiosa]|uniref:hypothetical protein n=1 Tax=Xylella fastidiosa TaxID=2371 RepID=UPI000FFF091E|nr:hypothetical protein [Xylella fastidiosa]RWA36724.1 hypothetical protein XfCFBP8078_11675 [Xylella fastidiosa subsp. multiplex]